MSPITPEQFRENGRKPFRVTDRGRVYIGDDEFPYPIRDGSIRVEKAGRSHHVVTLTIVVGSVSMEAKRPGPPALVVAESTRAARALADVLDLDPRNVEVANPDSMRNGGVRGIAQFSAIYVSSNVPDDADQQIALLASFSGAPVYQVDAASAGRQGFSSDVLIMDEPYAVKAQP